MIVFPPFYEVARSLISEKVRQLPRHAPPASFSQRKRWRRSSDAGCFGRCSNATIEMQPCFLPWARVATRTVTLPHFGQSGVEKAILIGSSAASTGLATRSPDHRTVRRTAEPPHASFSLQIIKIIRNSFIWEISSRYNQYY